MTSMKPPLLSDITTTADTSTPHQATYHWHEGTEDLEGYVQGGYHPILIGQTYHSNRYEIVHKLGFGSYSTVWLARDSQTSSFVALKFIVADASTTTSESTILSRPASGRADHPGRANVPTLIDEFYVTGPNGRHRCIVSDAAGCSIAESKEFSDNWMFPAKAARSIAAQFLQGLAYTHSCGIVHGDLHLNNILFKTPIFEAASTEALYKKIGTPQKLPVERVDKRSGGIEAPEYCVPAAIIVRPAEEVTEPKIIIADYGEAFIYDGKSRSDITLRTPTLLLPPESIFKDHLTPAIDVWTAASTLYEILGERPLFEGFMADEDHVVAEMISTLGMVPKPWWNKWSARSDFFNEDGAWRQETSRPHAPYSRPLFERLRIMGRGQGREDDEFGPRELGFLEELLKAMMAYEPGKRITASDALTTGWMKEFGIPAEN